LVLLQTIHAHVHVHNHRHNHHRFHERRLARADASASHRHPLSSSLLDTGIQDDLDGKLVDSIASISPDIVALLKEHGRPSLQRFLTALRPAMPGSTAKKSDENA
jgi:hypothetical protein